MKEARATYVYCLVSSDRPPRTTRAPRGLPGAGPPRALDAGGGLWLIAGDVPLGRYGEAAIEKGLRDLDWVSRVALGHEQVVQHFLGARAVLPMKLFTIFLGDERAVSHVTAQRRQLDRVLDRIAGCAEWGLRVTLADDKPAAKASARPTTGAAFLRGKIAARDAARERAAATRRAAEQAHELLADRAEDARLRRPGDDGLTAARLLLDAAYLVPARRAAAFRAAAKKATAGLARQGCTVAFSGPWPPYHFVGGA